MVGAVLRASRLAWHLSVPSRRPAARWRRRDVQIQFAQGPRESDGRIALLGDGRMRVWRTEAVGEVGANLGDGLARLFRGVPGLSRKLQEPQMVRVQLEVGHHGAIPGPRRGPQMSR